MAEPKRWKVLWRKPGTRIEIPLEDRDGKIVEFDDEKDGVSCAKKLARAIGWARLVEVEHA